MDDLVILLILLGIFSIALVAGEMVVNLWRKVRQRMLYPRNKWF